ncbi:hypothetical protein [Endozoicomonas ascidiicola]|uniref:hypothetical protein n=1 Tax=Endozoicomonas ascidiicola TaxID=1698521 RepID=UPI000834FB73|nr:hypothetical protein [Endozoicomonas ascidiicola]
MKSTILKLTTAFIVTCSLNVQSANIDGFFGLDTVYFVNTEFATKEIYSVIGEVRSRGSITDNLDYEFRLYGQKGISDYNEGYFDPTIAKVTWSNSSFRYDVGYDLVYWGVTEGINIVNVINQRDQIRDYFLKQGLGQSMISASYLGDDINLETYILPKFEELNFGGTRRPWGLGVPVDGSQSTYESDKGKRHIDYAARISGMIGELEYGIIYFDGTYKKSIYRLDESTGFLVPHYILGKTVGLDAQYISGSNIYKLEIAHFTPNSFKSYVSFAVGVERVLETSLNGSGESTVYFEYYYDTRQNDNSVAFQNDLFIAYKHSTYNAYDIETTIGGIVDVEFGGLIGTFNMTGKISRNLKLEFELIYFNSIKTQDALFYSKHFDQASLTLSLHY